MHRLLGIAGSLTVTACSEAVAVVLYAAASTVVFVPEFPGL